MPRIEITKDRYECFQLLEEAFDNMSKVFNEFNGFYEELPRYLRTEILHPKKKPRGSIRRKRNGVRMNGT